MKRRLVLALGAGLLEAGGGAAFAQAQPRKFYIFFDWNSVDFSVYAERTIRAAAQAIKASGQTKVTVIGHTDTSEDPNIVFALSFGRAKLVAEALVEEGIDAGAITYEGRGKDELLVKTADGVREPQNRRAEIMLT